MNSVTLGPRGNPRPGVWPHPRGGFQVALYAPTARTADFVAEGQRATPLESVGHGYFAAHLPELVAGTRYRLRTDVIGGRRPDPASLFQPDGVHRASEVIAIAPPQMANWRGRALPDMVVYELHVGTFSAGGTFADAIEHLDALVELGVNTLELMPLNAFPGARNWGYDGVYWQAAQESYGGPKGLRAFIDAAHERQLAVIVDAVFNHLGPEGNYLGRFAPYLNENKRTPWGPALNTDAEHADGVRDLVLSVAHTWLVDYGADGLRLDAVHALADSSAVHVLAELAEEAENWQSALGRPLTLIAECDLNDPRYTAPVATNGLGMRGQWVDEFHHALRAFLTGETRGYYSDFGAFERIAKSLREAFVFTGQYSEHRKRSFGESPSPRHEQHQFVVFGQNHDQVGNRARGERLHEHLDERDYLLTAAMVIWSPFTPMLWMGEEYAEPAPFPYFVGHTDEAVMRGTREGRMREFAPFLQDGERVPDPGLAETFASAKLSHQRQGPVYEFYRKALQVRRDFWPSRERAMGTQEVLTYTREVVHWRLPRRDSSVIEVIANLGQETFDLAATRLKGDTARASSQPLDAPGVPARTAAVWLTNGRE